MDIEAYKIIECGSVFGLSRIVNECLKDGFVPYGYPFVHDDMYYQTMINRELEPDASTSMAELVDKPNHTIQEWKDELKRYLDEWLAGVEEYEEELNSFDLDVDDESTKKFYELQRYDDAYSEHFINGAAAFVAFSCKRKHITPIRDN